MLTQVLGFFADFIFLSLFAAALKSSAEAALKISFSVLLFFFFCWQTAALIIITTANVDVSKIMYGIFIFSFYCIAAFYLPFSSSFLNKKYAKLFILAAGGLMLLIAVITVFTGILDYVYSGKGGFLLPKLKPVQYFLGITSLTFLTAGLAILIQAYKKAESVYEKNRILYPLLGAVILICGIITNLTELKHYPIDVICTAINAILLGYAVIRKRVLRFGEAVRQGTVYFLSISLFFLVIFIISELTMKITGTTGTLKRDITAFSGLFLLVLVITLLHRSRIFIYLRKIIMGSRQSSHHLIDKYIRDINSIATGIELAKLLKITLDKCYPVLSLNFCFFDGYSYKCINDSGTYLDFQEKDVIIEGIHTFKGPFWTEEIKNNPDFSHFYSALTAGKKEGSTVVIPFPAGDTIAGFTIVELESTKKIYDQYDFEFFTSIGEITASALARIIACSRIENNLRTKETMLKEIHHRIKNNLQIISSLLNLQQTGFQEERMIEEFTTVQKRIRTIAQVHEYLYSSSNMAEINLKWYTENLIKTMYKELYEEKGIKIHQDIEPITINQATVIPLGLSINEILSNTYKYAFQEKESGTLSIRIFKQNNDSIGCRIKDNGIGFSQNPGANSPGIGHKVIDALINHQLNGSWEVMNNNGTEHIITFPLILS